MQSHNSLTIQLLSLVLNAASLESVGRDLVVQTPDDLTILRKIVSEMLGHASTSITDDIYAHVTPTMQRATAAIFDKVFSAR